MKIIKFEVEGEEKNGLIEDNNVLEFSSSIIEAINSPSAIKYKKDSVYKLEEIKVKSPVIPSKIVCVGLNYIDHAQELNMDIPDEPILFLKPSTAVIGHLDNVIYPNSSKQLDYEAEMGVVISKVAKNVKMDNADEYVGGFVAFNDITARDLQQKD